MFIKLNKIDKTKKNMGVKFDDIRLIYADIIQREEKQFVFKIKAESSYGEFESDGLIATYPFKEMSIMQDNDLESYINTVLMYIISPDMIHAKVLANIDVALISALNCKEIKKKLSELI